MGLWVVFSPMTPVCRWPLALRFTVDDSDINNEQVLLGLIVKKV